MEMTVLKCAQRVNKCQNNITSDSKIEKNGNMCIE